MKFATALVAISLAGLTALADPPGFNPPAEIKPIGGYALYTPPADCVSVEYIGLDGEDAFPVSQIGGNKTSFFFPVRGLPEGKVYRFAGIASSKDGTQVKRYFAVPIPAPTTPPVVVPPTQPGPFYFLVVRPDGDATADFTTAMRLPGWDTLRVGGHLVNVKTATQARALGAAFADTQTPCVVILKVTPAGSQELNVVPLPKSDADIAKLPTLAK